MIFERTGPHIEMEEYFEDGGFGGFRGNEETLNNEFIGWVYMYNKDDRSMCNIYYVENYNNDDGKLHFSISQLSDETVTMDDINNHNDIFISRHSSSDSEIFKEDTIYKLEEYKEEEKEPVIKWWKKGKFESMKTDKIKGYAIPEEDLLKKFKNT